MKKSIEDVGRDYIAYAKYPSPAKDAPEKVQAEALDLGWLVEDDPEKAWEAIRYVIHHYTETDLLQGAEPEPRRVVGLLAAGPIEDFLSLYGPNYIDRVEAEASRDRRVAWALGGVWQATMPDDVWDRIQRVAIEWRE